MNQIVRNVTSNAPVHDFTRLVIAVALTRGAGELAGVAREVIASRWPDNPALQRLIKAPVAPVSTTDTAFGLPLVQVNTLAQAFIETLRPATIMGRMAGFRRVPFNVRFPRATAGSNVGWIGQAAPSPATNLSLESETVPFAKVGGIVAFTVELLKFSDPSAEGLIQQDLAAAVAAFFDQQFLDPSVAPVSNFSPGAITNGAATVASSGTTAAAFAADFRALMALITTNMVAPYLIMKPCTAIALAAMDSHLTRNVGARGGDIAGIPVLVSAGTPSDGDSPSDNTIVAVDAAEVVLAEGQLEFDTSTEASMQMNSTPDSPATASTVMVSLWQHNMIGVQVSKYAYWRRRRDGAAAILTGVGY